MGSFSFSRSLPLSPSRSLRCCVHKRTTMGSFSHVSINDRLMTVVLSLALSLSRSLALSVSLALSLSRALSRKRLTVGSLSLAHLLSHEHPKMGSLALSFSLSLALSLRISTTGWQRLSTVVPCRHVVSGPNDRRWVFSLSLSHSFSLSLDLTLSLSLSLALSLSRPRFFVLALRVFTTKTA